MKQFFTMAIAAAAGAALAAAQDVVVVPGPAPQIGVVVAQAAPPKPPAQRKVSEARVFNLGPASGSYLGIGVQEINADRARELKLPEVHGVEVTRVEEDSPAAKAGLMKGDVVLEYNGQRVEGTEQFVRLVRETPPGRQATLLISRNGVTQTVTATIGERRNFVYRVRPDLGEWEELRESWRSMWPDPKFQENMARLQEDLRRLRQRMPDMPGVFMAIRSGMLGIEAETLNTQLAEFFGVKQGVLVRSVAKDSAAEKAGIKAGDVIVRIDNEEVATASALGRRVREMESRASFPLTVVRNRQEMVLNVEVEKKPSGSIQQREVKPSPAPSRRPRAVRVGSPFAASPIL